MSVATDYQDLAEWIRWADQAIVAEVLAACAPELVHSCLFWLAHDEDEPIRPRSEYLGDYAEAWREEMGRRTDGHVYVLAGGGYHKIGRARRPVERVRTLAIQLPYEVETVHVAASDDYKRAELFLHDWFADSRVNGEWFLLSPDDLLTLGDMVRLGRFDGWQMDSWGGLA